jgi:uncharacterized protein YjbI with pentapeptide repeats
MKAQELLLRYAAGEHDFREADLRGQNFRGQNLSKIDLSSADIRGTNFNHANLSGANFTHVTAGLQLHSKLILLVACFLIAMVLGGVLSLSSYAIIAKNLISQDPFGIITLMILVGFSIFLVIVRQPLLTVLLATIVTAAISEMGYIATGLAATIALILVLSIAGVLGQVVVILSVAIAEVGAIAYSVTIHQSGKISTPYLIAATILTIPIIFVSVYISQQVLAGNPNYPFIRWAALILSCDDGTKFRGADLTDANFTHARLKGTDFRRATLAGVFWFAAKDFNMTCIDNGSLKDPKIQKLVVTLDGKGQNFDGFNLEAVNLKGANLQDVSLIGTNLNHASLQNVNLSSAILQQTQLESADLTGAILTGAYVEDWGITSTTQLDFVQCEYLYLRVPTKDNPNPLRKPDNLRETFAVGEFTDFIQPFFDTLDLYHSQNVDPRAISIALRNLSANHPDANLQFVAIERRGNTGVNLRFTTAPTANKSELSHEYFANYAQIRKELPIAIQMQLAEQDAEIRTLKGTIEQFIQTGTHSSTIQAETIQVIQGELVVTENRGININAGDNANIQGLSSGDGILNLGTIGGNVTHAIHPLPDASESGELNLKTLLTQLQDAIQTDTNLPDPDKSDLLEQVQALAEAQQTEEPTQRESITRKALKMFDATLKGLPDTAKIVEACSKLLPLILKALSISV